MAGTASGGIGGSVAGAPVPAWIDDGYFEKLSKSVQKTFAQSTSDPKSRLFQVESDDLFDVYLSHLPAGAVQHHSCNCCRQFVVRFGGLVTIGEGGKTRSAVWDAKGVPGLYQPAVEALRSAVEARAVDAVQVSCDAVWGTPKSKDRALNKTWKHFNVVPPKALVHDRKALDSATSTAATVREHQRTLTAALEEFPIGVAQSALNLARAGTLQRAEIVLAAAEHFHRTHEELSRIRGKQKKANYIWSVVSTAPAGWCTPKTSMLGTLLKGYSDGDPVEKIVRAYNARVDPTKHLRPQAPTTSGNIVQAERLVEQMGIRPSLARRHASLADVRPVWLPTPDRARRLVSGGMFAGLQTKDRTRAAAPVPVSRTPVRIRWEKFSRTVLGQATKIEVLVQDYLNFSGLTAPADPHAPPVLQWDHEEARNPIAWYVYRDPTTAANWSLVRNSWTEVAMVCLQPSMWGEQESTHHGQSAVLLLRGARDRGGVGQALFPSILRAELHRVRATIEAHSNSTRMAPALGEEASGVRVADGSNAKMAEIRVTTPTGIQHYIIDTWD